MHRPAEAALVHGMAGAEAGDPRGESVEACPVEDARGEEVGFQ